MMLTNIGGYLEFHINLHLNVLIGTNIFSPRMAKTRSSRTWMYVSWHLKWMLLIIRNCKISQHTWRGKFYLVADYPKTSSLFSGMPVQQFSHFYRSIFNSLIHSSILLITKSWEHQGSIAHIKNGRTEETGNWLFFQRKEILASIFIEQIQKSMRNSWMVRKHLARVSDFCEC